MRHQNSLRKFNRTAAHRKSLFRNMATSLILHERFETTVEKAKDLRRVAEKLVTIGKVDTLAARRQAFSYVMDKAAVHKLFADIAPRFKSRNGGYTRVLRTRVRHGDTAEMAVVEFLKGEAKAAPKAEEPVAEKKPKAKKKAAAKA